MPPVHDRSEYDDGCYPVHSSGAGTLAQPPANGTGPNDQNPGPRQPFQECNNLYISPAPPEAQPREHGPLAPASRQRAGLFQCGYCRKNYNRADHLIRHVRSHTKERPYNCPVCSKGFARPDLLKRHVAGHQQGSANNGNTSAQTQYGRVSQACKACASAKLKCEEAKPCGRCRAKNIACEYSSTENQRVSESQDPNVLDNQNPGLHGCGDGGISQSITPCDSPCGVSTTSPAAQIPLPEISGQTSEFANSGNDMNSMDLTENYFPDFIQDMIMPPDEQFPCVGNPDYLYPPPNIRGFMDYGMETNLELNDSDFGHLHDFKQESSVIFDMLTNGPLGPMEETNQEPRNLAIGAEAFQKSSITDWTPGHHNSSYEEQGNLSLSADAFIQATRMVSGRILITERLSLSSRDRILAMVLDTCMPSVRPRIVESFLSMELLDGFVQCFCHWHSKQRDTWIHIPTLNPNTVVTELLGMIIAAGAVRMPIIAVQKLGFAMMESVRNSFFRRFDENSATTRHLHFLQAQGMKLQVGLWSGNKRICEITESMILGTVTMLRRSRKFRRTSYHPVVPQPEDDGEVLEQKWKNWIEQESFKRLVCRIYIHDAQASMAFSTTPLVSYAEFSAPLPMSQDLWRANTAYRWKDISLSKTYSAQDRIPSLADLLQDTSQLAGYGNKVDVQLAGLVILHAVYALIWEHSQLNRIARSREGYWSGVILDSRQQEINHALQHFRAQFTDYRATPEVKLLLEVVSMHLYMCLEELQLYAGKEDKEEARRAYFSLRQWANSPASRRAVSHAGQVIRAAKEFEPDTLRDFNAVAVYHASLAFWCYGVVLQAQKVKSSQEVCGSPFECQAYVFLDDIETPEQHTYISFGSGRPGIQGPNGAVWLEDTPGIMETVRDILLSNYRNIPPPPLAMNLMQLMDDLGKAARFSNS